MDYHSTMKEAFRDILDKAKGSPLTEVITNELLVSAKSDAQKYAGRIGFDLNDPKEVVTVVAMLCNPADPRTGMMLVLFGMGLWLGAGSVYEPGEENGM